MTTRMSTADLRELIRDALPVESAEYGAPPPRHQFFVPKTHARALHINIPVVLGDRGMGKSYWWAALQSKKHRAMLGRVAPDARINEKTEVLAGFGKTLALDKYPSKDVFARLLAKGHRSRLIWKAVVAWGVSSPFLSEIELPLLESWDERVTWLINNPEPIDRMLQQTDTTLDDLAHDVVWVFDALDDAADDENTFYDIVEGLCQLALELRSFRHLRAKVFLRTDQFEDRRVGRFPDASKLRASTASLRWLTTELYGFLWQLLSNHPVHGTDYRQDLYTTLFKHELRGRGLSREEQQEILKLSRVEEWKPPPESQFDPAMQERLFHRLTGPYMGENARKGFPYRWLPTHLADAHGVISPRSFLTALATAVHDSMDRYVDHDHPIHYRSLHTGVHEASRIRVGEIAEYPWVKPLMTALEGQIGVPFELAEAEVCWSDPCFFLDADFINASIDSGKDAAKRLTTLGVWREMKTGRIDVPDIYRLGFKLARRGGVPLRPTSGAS